MEADTAYASCPILLPAVIGTKEPCGEEICQGGVSGPEKEMPWSNERDFVDALERNNTKILLGGYKTVLKDPLPGEEYNVHIAADMLAGMVVKNGQVFSQNSAIGPYTKDKGFREGPTYIGTMVTTTIGGGVCKIASALYNTAVLSDMKIIERHNHTMPVPYVPYGQDATVSYGNKDIRFQNNSGADIMIWAKGIGNVLYMAFYGSKPAPDVQWKHQVLQTTKAPFMYKINPQMCANEKKLLVEGMDGAVVKSWVTVTSDESSETRYMGMSKYQPMPHLIEKGPDP
ncbi:MAG: VanW family protein [Clostridiaceae bacterium]|jgi:vancomycin resistance protein YoaR|nr:VanW family protein [Clostridiaceae bacterium]